MLGCATPTDVLDGLETDWPAWSTSTRPLIVDLIAWPSLRDQMIFHSSFYDLDEMTEDIINYTVADIPEQRIALQLYSRPPNPFPYVPRPDENTSDTPFKFSTNERTLKILQIQNQELYDIISRRMVAPASGDGTDQPCFGIPGSPQSECIPAKTCTSKKFKGWKLSTIFFKKYPFLQCPSCKWTYDRSHETLLTCPQWLLCTHSAPPRRYHVLDSIMLPIQPTINKQVCMHRASPLQDLLHRDDFNLSPTLNFGRESHTAFVIRSDYLRTDLVLPFRPQLLHSDLEGSVLV